jgi:hypothetical protein
MYRIMNTVQHIGRRISALYCRPSEEMSITFRMVNDVQHTERRSIVRSLARPLGHLRGQISATWHIERRSELMYSFYYNADFIVGV